jgi:hypothetical protein
MAIESKVPAGTTAGHSTALSGRQRFRGGNQLAVE